MSENTINMLADAVSAVQTHLAQMWESAAVSISVANEAIARSDTKGGIEHLSLAVLQLSLLAKAQASLIEDLIIALAETIDDDIEEE